MMNAAGQTGDIWNTCAFSFESPLKDLLDRGDFTVEEVLNEDELLQEIRGMHPQLLDFFSGEDVMASLVRYMTQEPLLAEQKLVTNNPPPMGMPNNGETDPDLEETSEQDQNDATSDENNTIAPAEEMETDRQVAEVQYIRFPFLACEVICCEVNVLLDTLVEGRVPPSEDTDEGNEPILLLDLLFSLLTNTKIGDMDDRRAGYFDKVISVLMQRRPMAVTNYLNQGGSLGVSTIMNAFFNHMYSHSIMQVLQRLLMPQQPVAASQEGNEPNWNGEEIHEGDQSVQCTWSSSPEALELLLQRLVGCEYSMDVSGRMDREDIEEARLEAAQNASEVLLTVIQNSPLTSPTLLALTSDPILKRIIDSAVTLREEEEFSMHDSTLTCSMNVLESLVLQLGGYGAVGTMGTEVEEIGNAENSEDNEPPQRQMAEPSTLVNHLPRLLVQLSNLLRDPITSSWRSKMQFDETEPKKLLGTSRLRIVRLLESLVLLGNPQVDEILCESNCLATCLDLFWEFEWCSMLHQSVANLLVHVFEGANARASLQEYFINQYDLLRRLMDSFEMKRKIGSRLERHGLDEGEQNIAVPPSVSSTDVEHGTPDNSVNGDEGENGALSDQENPQSVPDRKDAIDAENSEESGQDVTAARPQESENESSHVAETSKEVESTPLNGDKDDEKSLETFGSFEATDMMRYETGIIPFRMGFMGHVIIICQALVHVCTTAVEAQDGAERDLRAVEMSINGENSIEAKIDGKKPSLKILELIQKHASQERWQHFVTTTLAEETAIQSTPLGGYQENHPSAQEASMCPLTLERGDGIDDSGAMIGGGLLDDGAVLDIDDGDLDMSSGMRDVLSMTQLREATMAAEHGVGIEMMPVAGQMTTEYHYDDPLAREDIFDDEDSDEGYGSPKGTVDESDSNVDVPVMDLFTGNFSFNQFQEQSSGNTQLGGGEEWSNFANFDDAFAGFPGNTEVSPSTTEEGEQVIEAVPKPKVEPIDDIFAKAPDAASLLLGEEETQAKAEMESAQQAAALEGDDSSDEE